MSDAIADFVDRARAVSIEAAARRLGLKFRKSGHEHPQACPIGGGTDRFSFNTEDNKWNCRGCSIGGRDAIGMAAHCHDLDLKRRDGFLGACELVSGEPIPEGGERESDADRAERERRIAERQARAAEAEAKSHVAQEAFREKERRRARGIYEAGAPLVSSALDAGRRYLQARCCGLPDDRWLRVAKSVTYWHGNDELGRAAEIHSGPAMIAPFVDADGLMIGCHITWIDLDAPPKFRPALHDPSTGEVLPTKKMRGSKQGGLIPLSGDPGARRWVGGEGIENGLAFAAWEGFRPDTFYFAAGDLGNLAGQAKARFAHPELTLEDRRGRTRAVMVAGPEPKLDSEAMRVPDHVTELVLLGDGDSEPVMTVAAMQRARLRHARPGRAIFLAWPPAGMDFSQAARVLR